MNDMDSQQTQAFTYALRQAYAALKNGNKRTARRWAQQAAALGPDREEAWLILASVASPKASVSYLQQALQINPSSERARQGMHWAVQRLRESGSAAPAAAPAVEDTAETVIAEVDRAAAAAAPVEERAGDEAFEDQAYDATTEHAGVFEEEDTVATSIEDLPTAAGAAVTEPAPRPEIRTTIRPEDRLRRRSALLPLLSALTFVCLLAAVWFSSPMLVQALTSTQFASVSIVGLLQPTDTPVPTAVIPPTETFTPAPSDTPLPSVTPLPSLTPNPTNTPTPTPTDTPTPLPTNTPVPTPVPTQVPTQPPPSVSRPDGVGAKENWIDVDLSEQILRAYTGDTLVGTFVVSTGTWQHPTVTGTYKVYVKYTFADMSGPGYYLANVPYVMYFYQGYGIHGTYWHNNFGTPMSHGCVNMTIDDAGWMFDFSVVGTVVNVHN